MKIDLIGKTALVTGAGRGIGRAIADSFADNGATVLYTDIDADAARATAAPRENCCGFEMDVTRNEQIADIMQHAVREYVGLDVLVNNVGINTLAHRVTADQFPIDEWEKIVNVDQNGLFLVSRRGSAS